jgi:hypothetical protein
MDVASGWRVKESNSEYVLFPPEGGPVLTITNPLVESAPSVESLTLMNGDQLEDGHPPTCVSYGDFVGLEFEYVEDAVCCIGT